MNCRVPIYFVMKTAINMIEHIFGCRKSTVYGSFKSTACNRNKASKKKKRKRQHLVKRNLLTQEQSDEEGNTLNKEPKLRTGLKTCKISITSTVGRMAYIAINANWTLSNFVPISEQCANVVPINSVPYTQSIEPNSKTNIEGNSIVRSSLYQHIKRGELFATEPKVAVSSFHFSCIFQARASSLEMELQRKNFIKHSPPPFNQATIETKSTNTQRKRLTKLRSIMATTNPMEHDHLTLIPALAVRILYPTESSSWITSGCMEDQWSWNTTQRNALLPTQRKSEKSFSFLC
ncbi:hypothetical protein DdX_18014 [Ditylenchus destructor]|uniref:Uncharacterized protein n=1 Tax=Ditylenchus destructor TaxID=166010 RepID=A0AAD4QT32_9BILA|nr:hypothetical protein DdX_18014 [Ditylenchus destructor]